MWGLPFGMLGDSRLQESHDFAVVRETADRVFREDLFSVNGDLINATCAWNQRKFADF